MACGELVSLMSPMAHGPCGVSAVCCDVAGGGGTFWVGCGLDAAWAMQPGHTVFVVFEGGERGWREWRFSKVMLMLCLQNEIEDRSRTTGAEGDRMNGEIKSHSQTSFFLDFAQRQTTHICIYLVSHL